MAIYSDSGLARFYKGLYLAVDDPSLDSIISWSKGNKSFIIWNPREFETSILAHSLTILCNDFIEFFSELEYFGFERVNGTEHLLEFGHDKYFLRGKPELMKEMQRESYWERMRGYMRKRAMVSEVATSLTNMSL